MANDFVLDASALLALLNAEEGHGLVLEVLSNSVISAVNLAEVITRLSARGMPEKEIRETLGMLGLEIVPFDEEQSFQAGLIARHTSRLGLSLGDRACLALSLATRRIALTADRAWGDLDIGVKIKLVRH